MINHDNITRSSRDGKSYGFTVEFSGARQATKPTGKGRGGRCPIMY